MARPAERPWHRLDSERPQRRDPLRLALAVLATGSCSTAQLATVPQVAPIEIAAAHVSTPIIDAPPELLDPAAPPALVGETAVEANLALPLSGPGTSAPAMILASAPPLAQLRAHDCLAQAIYYEARSESEDGQRAVAQVVLNRVRHPAWPNSVCGVVYQGPMRAGGGCQFTFTCDGALATAPRGDNWVRARRLAAEALAGRVYAPVGLSTFYHANYVMPRWAPRLLKTAQIGAHIFYRMPGAAGTSSAFSEAYAGAEPEARPNPILVRYARNGDGPAIPEWLAPTPAPNSSAATARADVTAPQLPLTRNTVSAPEPVDTLQVRPEYRTSGQWRDDAPTAITGR